MSLSAVLAKDAPIPIAAYSQAIKAGGFIYLSGLCGLTVDGKLVGKGDMKAQTQKILDNIKAVLDAGGSSMDKIVKVNIFVTDMSLYKQVNEVYSQVFVQHKPARSCVEVKSLPVPDALIEIEAIALE